MAHHEIYEALTDSEILDLFPVMRELHRHIPSPEEFLRLIRIQQEEGVHFLYIKDTLEGETTPRVVSTTSYRILHNLYYYRQLYLNDVVTHPLAKRRGYAGALTQHVVELARREKCNVATLTSVYARREAHRMYMNKGFYTKGHHFVLDIDSPHDLK